MADNNFDSVFSESTPAHLKQAIMQQAEIILAQNRKREMFKKFAVVFGGLAMASVVGINISRQFFKSNDSQMEGLAQLLSSEDNLELAELSDEDLELLEQLDHLEPLDGLSDEEFEYILKEDV